MRAALVIALVIAAALGLTACGFGKEGVAVSKDSPDRAGAELFSTHCAGCHTLDAAGTQGTGNRGARTQGPNLNEREESKKDVLYAIQNGGFSGAIMPQNVVVGEEAERVAEFVAKYAGQASQTTPRPGQESSP